MWYVEWRLHWFALVKELCSLTGIPLSLCLFKWYIYLSSYLVHHIQTDNEKARECAQVLVLERKSSLFLQIHLFTIKQQKQVSLLIMRLLRKLSYVLWFRWESEKYSYPSVWIPLVLRTQRLPMQHSLGNAFWRQLWCLTWHFVSI